MVLAANSLHWGYGVPPVLREAEASWATNEDHAATLTMQGLFKLGAVRFPRIALLLVPIEAVDDERWIEIERDTMLGRLRESRRAP